MTIAGAAAATSAPISATGVIVATAAIGTTAANGAIARTAPCVPIVPRAAIAATGPRVEIAPPRGDRPDRDPDLRAKYIKGKGEGRHDKAPDPNSPFAKLAALKEQLESNAKEPR